MKYAVSMCTLYGITGYNFSKMIFPVASWEYFERLGDICMYSQTGIYINK